MERFIEWAHHSLMEDDDAQTFLRSRGSSSDQWARHRIGYVPSEFDVEYRSHPGHSDICLDRDRKFFWCDACRYRRWSSSWEGEENEPKQQFIGRRIIGRVVLPLTSYSGTVVGFQVRSIQNKDYDTFIVNRHPEAYFFGLKNFMDEIWRRKEVSIVEGSFDQMIFERLVDPSVLALNTSAINPSQMKFLHRFVNRVNLCLDFDEAGRDGQKNFIEQCGSDFNILSVKYPRLVKDEKDIGDIWKRVGDNQISKHFRREIQYG